MKKIYLMAWVLLAASVIVVVKTGNVNPLTILAFSFITFALAYGFALWLVFTNDPDAAANNRAIKILIHKE